MAKACCVDPSLFTVFANHLNTLLNTMSNFFKMITTFTSHSPSTEDKKDKTCCLTIADSANIYIFLSKLTVLIRICNTVKSLCNTVKNM